MTSEESSVPQTIMTVDSFTATVQDDDLTTPFTESDTASGDFDDFTIEQEIRTSTLDVLTSSNETAKEVGTTIPDVDFTKFFTTSYDSPTGITMDNMTSRDDEYTSVVTEDATADDYAYTTKQSVDMHTVDITTDDFGIITDESTVQPTGTSVYRVTRTTMAHTSPIEEVISTADVTDTEFITKGYETDVTTYQLTSMFSETSTSDDEAIEEFETSKSYSTDATTGDDSVYYASEMVTTEEYIDTTKSFTFEYTSQSDGFTEVETTEIVTSDDEMKTTTEGDTEALTTTPNEISTTNSYGDPEVLITSTEILTTESDGDTEDLTTAYHEMSTESDGVTEDLTTISNNIVTTESDGDTEDLTTTSDEILTTESDEVEKQSTYQSVMPSTDGGELTTPNISESSQTFSNWELSTVSSIWNDTISEVLVTDQSEVTSDLSMTMNVTDYEDLTIVDHSDEIGATTETVFQSTKEITAEIEYISTDTGTITTSQEYSETTMLHDTDYSASIITTELGAIRTTDTQTTIKISTVPQLISTTELTSETTQEPLIGSVDDIFCFMTFYPPALKGCRGIVFTHGVWMGGRVAGKSLSGLYLRNRKV